MSEQEREASYDREANYEREQLDREKDENEVEAHMLEGRNANSGPEEREASYDREQNWGGE